MLWHGVRDLHCCSSCAKWPIVNTDEKIRQRLSRTWRTPSAAIHAMNLRDFQQSLDGDAPTADIDSQAVQALWFAAKGDWTRAHELAQSQDDAAGAWVHAYLHRVEDDIPNAQHWYRRAGKPPHRGSLTEEWNENVSNLI